MDEAAAADDDGASWWIVRSICCTYTITLAVVGPKLERHTGKER